MARYSETRGRPLTRAEAWSEAFAMSRLGYRYPLHLAPRIDRPRLIRVFRLDPVHAAG